MKKIKYLLGLSIVGLGLLINQSFAASQDEYLNVELVKTSFSPASHIDDLFAFSNYSYSYSRLYSFNNHHEYDSRNEYCQSSFLGYNLYYNKQNIYSYSFNGYMTSCPSIYSSSAFNNSLFGLDIYTPTCYTFYNRGDRYCSDNYGSNNYSSMKVLLGKNNNFGKNALLVSTSNSFQSPKYFLGGGFFVNSDFDEFSYSDLNGGLRLFFNALSGENQNFGDFDIVYPYSGQDNSFMWEFFTNTQTRTSLGYIIDTYGYKGKHWGSMGIGYSFVYNKNSLYQGTQISWDNLGFKTVSDYGGSMLEGLGNLNFNQTSGTGGYFTDGLLILRKNQYTNNGNDGVIVISKNPNNVKQLLYQEFGCQSNDFMAMTSSGDSGIIGINANTCPVIGQGLLAINGNTDVLPFTNKTSFVNVSDSTLLSYFFNTSITILGGTYSTNSQFCIGDNPTGDGICFDKVSGNYSIKENYLNGEYIDNYQPPLTTGEINNGIYESCLTNSYFAAVNYNLCHGLNPSDILNINGDSYIITDVVNNYGEIVKKVIPLDDYENGTYNDGYFDYIVCNSNNPCEVVNSSSEYFTGGFLGTGYYDFNNTGMFFKCPYPYTSFFHIKDWNFNFGDFDLLGPINCFIAAFKHGKSIDAFDNVGLFDFGPLIQGDTSQHRILFRFFDFLLLLGITLFFSFLFHRLK